MKIRKRRFTEISMDTPNEAEDHLSVRELQDWGPNPEQRYSQEELRSILGATISELAPDTVSSFNFATSRGFRPRKGHRCLACPTPQSNQDCGGRDCSCATCWTLTDRVGVARHVRRGQIFRGVFLKHNSLKGVRIWRRKRFTWI
jgi:hypothetical protein